MSVNMLKICPGAKSRYTINFINFPLRLILQALGFKAPE